MNTERIEIKTSKEKFFLEYLILKKPVIDSILSKLNGKKTTLSDIPRTVLAQLLYYNDMYKDLSEQEKWAMVFNKETKDKICDTLDMKEHHLNIYITQLRNIKILDKKKINNLFVIYSNAIHNLNFTFKLNGYT